ncbi:MAG: hypothetical protein [Microvirus sp.]|nr:MAG: hypothetical protein [Microvirus sp.]
MEDANDTAVAVMAHAHIVPTLFLVGVHGYNSGRGAFLRSPHLTKLLTAKKKNYAKFIQCD